MTRRHGVVVFALVASVLVATAPAAAAGDPGLEVASNHSTATEFTNANTLQNVQVQGSGSSATVDLVKPTVIDGFEDGDATDTAASAWGDWSGDTASWTADGTTTIRGSFSGRLDASAGAAPAIRTQRSSDITTNTTVFVRVGSQTGTAGDSATLFLEDSAGGNVLNVEFRMDGNVFVESSDTGTDWSADTNYRVKVAWDFPNNQAEVFLDGTSLGTYGFNSASGWGGVELTLDNTEGSGSVSAWLDDPAETPYRKGTYQSQPHQASQVEQAFTDFSALNISANVTWEYYDGSTWQTAATAGYTTAGNKTLDVSGHASAQQWRVTVDYTRAADTLRVAASLDAEGVLFNASEPALDSSTMTPSGGAKSDTQSITLNISVSDADFATAQGDSVTVTYYHKGPNDNSFSQIGTDTRTANGTASLSQTFTVGGTHEWYAVASDEYGESVTSQQASFQVPSTLFIRNVSNASELITDATVTVTFFDSGTVVTRTTNDGTVDLTGLPVGGGFVALAEANGYYSRRVIIRSIYDQQSIYLLNETVTGVEIGFQLDDATGRFSGPNTTLSVQRPINQSGSTEWRTVIADYIGANNKVPAILEQDQRYRIIVRNQQESRVLGSYTATSATDPEILPIGQVSLEANVTGDVAVGGGVNNVSGVRILRFSYIDGADATSELTYRIVRADNTSNVVLGNQTIGSPQQRVTVTHNLTALDPGANASTGYAIQWWANRTGEPDRSGTVTVGGALPMVCLNLPMDPQVMHLIGYVTILASGGLAVFNPRLASMGMASTAAGVASLGCAPIPGPVVVLMIGIAVLHNVGGQLR